MTRKVVRRKIDWLPNQNVEVSSRELPVLALEDYQQRLAAARQSMGSLTHLVVYADREHFSNIEYFAGFDPRFEEALLVIAREGDPVLIVGNEGDSYAESVLLPVRKVVYTPFSLPGQPRGKVTPLEQHLESAGISSTSSVGVIGWKVFCDEDGLAPGKTFDLPFFILQALLKVVPLGNLSNAIGLMVDNDHGLRTAFGVKELLLSEYAGTTSTQNTLRVLQNLRPGITEAEASQYLQISGLPLGVHPNVNFGKNLDYGLASPMTYTQLKEGDVVGAGMAYRRTLCHKVGYYVKDQKSEPAGLTEFYDKYFRSVAAWYEAVCIGAEGGHVYAEVEKITGPLKEFGISLNPGHLIHTDEWNNTPFKPGCKSVLRSGMMIQCDFTSIDPKTGLIAHAEDGILLADADMRKKLEAASPAAWARIQERRRFMIDVLGIRLQPCVLPTSDIPGIIFPYLQDLSTVIAFEG